MVSSSETIAVVATRNVAASSAYYVRGAEYYLGSREPEGIWYAPRGDLGRRDAATVLPKEFARLYEGLRENGQSLITNMGGKVDRRIPAFDLTLSAPRSVSLAWAFADEDLQRNLEAAQLDALFEGTHSSRTDIAASGETMKAPMPRGPEARVSSSSNGRG